MGSAAQSDAERSSADDAQCPAHSGAELSSSVFRRVCAHRHRAVVSRWRSGDDAASGCAMMLQWCRGVGSAMLHQCMREGRSGVQRCVPREDVCVCIAARISVCSYCASLSAYHCASGMHSQQSRTVAQSDRHAHKKNRSNERNAFQPPSISVSTIETRQMDRWVHLASP